MVYAYGEIKRLARERKHKENDRAVETVNRNEELITRVIQENPELAAQILDGDKSV